MTVIEVNFRPKEKETNEKINQLIENLKYVNNIMKRDLTRSRKNKNIKND